MQAQSTVLRLFFSMFKLRSWFKWSFNTLLANFTTPTNMGRLFLEEYNDKGLLDKQSLLATRLPGTRGEPSQDGTAGCHPRLQAHGLALILTFNHKFPVPKISYVFDFTCIFVGDANIPAHQLSLKRVRFSCQF